MKTVSRDFRRSRILVNRASITGQEAGVRHPSCTRRGARLVSSWKVAARRADRRAARTALASGRDYVSAPRLTDRRF